MKLKIPCNEANHICDKTQYKDASFWDMVILNIHLLYCRACRKYTARNTKLSKAIQKAQVKSLPNQEKEDLKEKLRKAMAK